MNKVNELIAVFENEAFQEPLAAIDALGGLGPEAKDSVPTPSKCLR